MKPEEIKEAVYHCAPYIGLGKAENAVNVVNEVFAEKGFALPLASGQTVTEESRLADGIAAYEAAVQAHENGFHGAELPGCVGRAVFHGYADKTAALGAMSGKENRCPVCGGQMTAGKWYTQQGRRYLTKAHCETDGDFYIRVRLVHEDEALRVSRLVYEPTEQVAKSYAALAQKPRARRPRRRRSARVKAKPAEPKNP